MKFAEVEELRLHKQEQIVLNGLKDRRTSGDRRENYKLRAFIAKGGMRETLRRARLKIFINYFNKE